MKRRALFVGLLSLIAILSCSCGIHAPSEKELLLLVPAEVFQYEFDGTTYHSEVKSFEITKRQTDEKKDIAICELVLEDEAAIRTISLRLETSYWDKGGWVLDDWSHSDEIEPLIPIDKDRLIAEVAALGYRIDGLTEYTYEESPTHANLCLSVYEEHQNAIIHGDITINARLAERFTPSGCYTWYIEVDDSNVNIDWNIVGNWYGELYRETYTRRFGWGESEAKDYHLSIEILSLEEKDYSDAARRCYMINYRSQLELDHAHETPRVAKREYGDFAELQGSHPLDWHLETTLACTTFFRVDIYPDEAIAWERDRNFVPSLPNLEDWQSPFEKID